MPAKFVSYAEILRYAREVVWVREPAYEAWIKWIDNLTPGDRDSLETIGAMFDNKVAYGASSIGNCGTICLQNITAGWAITSYEVDKDTFKVVNRPAWLSSGFGGRLDLLGSAVHAYSTKLNKSDLDKQRLVKDFDTEVGKSYNSAVISDCVNRKSGYRGVVARELDTAAFMDLVEESKIGYLVKSPISANPLHISEGDLGLIRHWIYYPSSAIVMKADKCLASGNKIASSPEEFVEGFNAKLDRYIATGKFSRDYFMGALKHWRKGTIFEGKKNPVDKPKKV